MPINTTKTPPIKNHDNQFPQFPNNSRNCKNNTIEYSNNQANNNNNGCKNQINNKSDTTIIKDSTIMLTKA